MNVNWDDDIPNRWEHKIDGNQTTPTSYSWLTEPRDGDFPARYVSLPDGMAGASIVISGIPQNGLFMSWTM